MPNPFVIFFLPNTKKGFFWQQNNKEASSLTGKEFIFSAFSNNLSTLKIYPDFERDIIPDEISALFSNLSLEEKIDELSLPKLEKKIDYLKRISRVVDEIKAKKYKKIVCSRVVVQPRVNTLETIFFRLVKKFPKTFRYCFFTKESGFWMGASPEILIEKKESNFKTVSLAGTRKLEEDGSFYPFSKKEFEEQNIVTEYIQNVFENISDQPIKISETYPFNTGNLVHLKTDIKLSDTILSVIKVAKALHPTPAVCGLPQNKTKEILKIDEPFREYYTGFLGPKFNEDNAEFFVNLRCMKLTKSNAFIFVGGGITSLSDPEDEWSETYWKSKTMAELL